MKSIEERIKDAEAEVARLKEEHIKGRVYVGARFRHLNGTTYTIVHVEGLRCWWKTKTSDGVGNCSKFLSPAYKPLDDVE